MKRSCRSASLKEGDSRAIRIRPGDEARSQPWSRLEHRSAAIVGDAGKASSVSLRPNRSIRSTRNSGRRAVAGGSSRRMQRTSRHADERLIVTTAPKPFTLYVTVSLYAAIALSIPFLLVQVWGFISPALYKHERAYVTPFILVCHRSRSFSVRHLLITSCFRRRSDICLAWVRRFSACCCGRPTISTSSR